MTLAGFPKGAELESIRPLVAEWARSVAPLELEVEKAGHFTWLEQPEATLALLGPFLAAR